MLGVERLPRARSLAAIHRGLGPKSGNTFSVSLGPTELRSCRKPDDAERTHAADKQVMDKIAPPISALVSSKPTAKKMAGNMTIPTAKIS